MPFCDQCGAENPTGARFCDQCGAPMLFTTPTMGTVPSVPTSGPAIPPPVFVSAHLTCPSCGASVIAGQAFCDECGAPLLPPAVGAPTLVPVPEQQQYPPPQPVAAVPAAPTPLPPPAAHGLRSLSSVQVHIPQRGVSLVFSDVPQAIIGRADPVSESFPDIDLTPYGGLEQGVGRRHVRLYIDQGTLYIDDLQSTNGTFVNGTKLIPGTPRALQASDDVRLGNMPIRIQW